MENLQTLIDLLGETNVEHLKKGITDVLIKRVENDIKDWDEYILSPEEFTEFAEEILEESKKEVKDIVKNILLKDVLQKFKIVAAESGEQPHEKAETE